MCLVISRNYIENHFADIAEKASVIEKRLDDSNLNKKALIAENNIIFPSVLHTACRIF